MDGATLGAAIARMKAAPDSAAGAAARANSAALRAETVVNSMNLPVSTFAPVAAADTRADRLFRHRTASRVSVTGATAKQYSLDTTKTYAFSAEGSHSSPEGFAFVTYLDSNGQVVSYEHAMSSEDQYFDKTALQVPSGAASLWINSTGGDCQLFEAAPTAGRTLPEIVNEVLDIEKNKEISILFIGNSLTQDGIAYLPYLLTSFYPGIRFKFYMWYCGGYTLAQHYSKFSGNETCDIFSVAENTASWTNSQATMADILSAYTFDIVCMQEYFNHRESFSSSDLSDWTNCRSYIESHYTGGNPLKFVSLFHAPIRESADSIFELTKAGNALILQNTITEDMIPNGIAVYRALDTDLDNLGDQGHLSPDGTHTQEGLPCLLQTYVALQWIFDQLSIPKSVYGFPFKMTSAVYSTLNVPGSNPGTGLIEGSDAQNLLAQKVAIQAYKEGKKMVADNVYGNVATPSETLLYLGITS